MTVNDIIQNPDFNNAAISQSVFGNPRIISDKRNCNRNKRWTKSDDLAIKEYFEKKYKINLEVT